MNRNKYLILVAFIIGILGVGLFMVNKKSNQEDEFISYTVGEDTKESSKEEIKEPIFTYGEVPENIKKKMYNKSVPKDLDFDYSTLSYLNLTYYGFDNKVHYDGEMIVNSEIASEVVDIFKELYDKKYQIEKIKLIDEYDAKDNLSMADNNSSAFCYRTIGNSDKLSNHAKGMAIDINPLQNPHVISGNPSPKEAMSYVDRGSDEKHMIKENDDCYNAFVKRGWTWGGHWDNPDYQHFEK